MALAMAGAVALAAGTPGSPRAGVFSIDDAAFDAGNVGATACPVGFTCTNLIGSGGEMLQREIVDDGTNERTLQLIIGDTTDGSFATETQHQFDTQNQIDAKLIISQIDLVDADNNFYTEQTMYRGDGDPSGGFPQEEVIQILGGDGLGGAGWQSFNMLITDIPFNSNQIGNNDTAIIDIDQDLGGAAGVFAHRVRKDGGLVNDFSVSVTDGTGATQDITVVGGAADGALTATYIGSAQPGVFGVQGDFGVLIYRYWDDVVNNSAGSTQGDVPTQEIRATSLASEQDSGDMTGIHGSFENGDATTMGWDDTLFGPAPN